MRYLVPTYNSKYQNSPPTLHNARQISYQHTTESTRTHTTNPTQHMPDLIPTYNRKYQNPPPTIHNTCEISYQPTTESTRTHHPPYTTQARSRTNLQQKVPEPTTHPIQHMPDLVPTSPFTSPLYTTHANRV
jgi:hypothetical protein